MSARHPGERYTDLLVLVVPAFCAAWVLLPGWRVDPDSYYHLGLSQVLAERGWVTAFPWLDLTVLGQRPFVDAHLLTHLVVAPLAAVLPPITAMAAAVVLLSSALWLSVFAVLRRQGIAHPGVWTVLGAFSSPFLVTHAAYLKGAGVFLVILVWFCEALLRGSPTRAFVLSWLSVYAYVGAPLLPVLAVVVATARRFWSGTWAWRLAVASVAGLLAGLVLHPSWPNQWGYVARELAGMFDRPDFVVPGGFFGFEWASLTGGAFLRFAWVPVAAWMALLLTRLRGTSPLPIGAAVGTVLALGFLVAALLQAKFLHHFLVLSCLFLPLALAPILPARRRVKSVLLVLAITAGAWNVRTSFVEDRGPGENPAAEAYAAMGAWLPARTADGERVLAPWDDFPGLFLNDRWNRYVVGLNPLFLMQEDEVAFKAYYFLYNGQVADPQNLLPRYFGDARYVLARARPRNPGERDLLASLASNPAFVEEPSPASAWRVFHLAAGSGR